MVVKTKKVLEAMIENYRLQPGSSEDYSLKPSCPFVSVADTGEFVFEIAGEFGAVTAFYDPIDGLTKLLGITRRHLAETEIKFEPSGTVKKLCELFTDKAAWLKFADALAASVLLYVFRKTFDRSFDQLIVEAACQFEVEINAVIKREYQSLESNFELNEAPHRQAMEVATNILLKAAQKKYRQELRSNLSGMPNFAKLPDYRERLLPIWRQVKKVHKKYKERSNWQDIIKVTFADENLPDDLIAQLGREKDYRSAAANIALQHAARLCGAKPDQFSLRTLQDKLKHKAETLAPVNDLTH